MLCLVVSQALYLRLDLVKAYRIFQNLGILVAKSVMVSTLCAEADNLKLLTVLQATVSSGFMRL